MNKIFRIIILISIGSYVLLLFAPYNIPAIYDQSTLDALGWNGYGSNQLFYYYASWVFIVLYLLSALGLWFFIKEARFLYFAVIAFDLLSAPFGGLWVLSGIDAMLSYISTLLDGIILFMAFMSPVSQEFKSVKSLKWPQDDQLPKSPPLDDLSPPLLHLISAIRTYKVASWSFALFIGFLFQYSYGLAKKAVWIKRSISFLPKLIDPNSETQVQVITVAANVIAVFTSSLIPALICGGLLVYFFQQRATNLSIWSAGIFLVLSFRFWSFWKAPNVGLQISIFIGPFISILVLVSAIVLILKMTNRITRPSTHTRGKHRGKTRDTEPV